VPLLDFESCNLGSINLSKMLLENERETVVNWTKLQDTIHLGIRFLDNIITLNYYVLPEIESITKANRKIGLGIMGWAEMLFMLEIPYASKKAVALAEKLMQFIQNESYIASTNLAKEKGQFYELENSTHYLNMALRNATCNSIAPTGSISVIANTSYAIEPLFALAYKRVGVLENKTQIEINKIFIKKIKQLGYWNKEIENCLYTNGTIKNVKSLPDGVKKIFETSLEIPWDYHLLHQKAFQKHTDNAVSKTINLPEKTTIKEISEMFWSAWTYKLKGITIYRNGSRDEQVLQKCNFISADNCH